MHMRGLLFIVAALAMVSSLQGAVYSDNFESYAPGALGGQDGWTNPVPGRIDVVAGAGVGGSQALRITGQGLTGGNPQTSKTIPDVSPDPSGVITVLFDVKGGVLNDARTMWAVFFNDSAGKNLARVYTGAGTVRGRIGASGVVTSTTNLSSNNIWDTVKILIDTNAKTSSFFLSLNGGAFSPFAGTNTLSYAAETTSTKISSIVWEATQANTADVNGFTIHFDNLSLTPEPSTALLLLGGMGALAARRTRRAS